MSLRSEPDFAGAVTFCGDVRRGAGRGLRLRRGIAVWAGSGTRLNLVPALAPRQRGLLRNTLVDSRPFLVSTDDAYVRAQNTTLAAKVSGLRVAAFEVEDNAQSRQET